MRFVFGAIVGALIMGYAFNIQAAEMKKRLREFIDLNFPGVTKRESLDIIKDITDRN